MKKIVFLFVLAFALISCGFGNQEPFTRDVYFGHYLLDITGSVPLVGAEGTDYEGLENELVMDRTESDFSILTHVEATNRIASISFWQGMPGTVVDEPDGSHYLLFDDKEIKQEVHEGDNTFTYIYMVHNREARLSENNKVLTWMIDLRVEISLNGMLIYTGESPISNRAVRK